MASSSSSPQTGHSAPITPYRDGKISIEHHISIDIMDALAIMSGVEKNISLHVRLIHSLFLSMSNLWFF